MRIKLTKHFKTLNQLLYNQTYARTYEAHHTHIYTQEGIIILNFWERASLPKTLSCYHQGARTHLEYQFKAIVAQLVSALGQKIGTAVHKLGHSTSKCHTV